MSCSEVSSKKLSTQEKVSQSFVNASGFILPEQSSDFHYARTGSDLHGDYTEAMSFLVSEEDIKLLESLPSEPWGEESKYSILELPLDYSKFDERLASMPTLIAPKGSSSVEVTLSDDIRQLVIDKVGKRVYFYRVTW